MPSDSQSAKQNPPPIPPRFTWLRRGALGFILLLLILLALRLWWGHEANRRFADLARAAYARGEPFYPEDFRRPPIPDAENAAIPIKTALIGAAQSGGPQYSDLQQWENAAPLESELSEIAAIVAGYRPELNLVRSARNLPDTSWNMVPAFLRYPYLYSPRTLADVLIISARLERARSHDGQAIEYVRDELELVDALDCSDPSVSIHLVVIRLSNLASRFIRESAMNLQISQMPTTDATAAQVRALITTLLEEQPLIDGIVRDFHGERAMAIDSIPRYRSLIDLPHWTIKPAYQMDAARIAQLCTAEGEASRQINWPAAKAKLKSDSDYSSSSVMEFPDVTDWPTNRPAQHHFQMLAERRVAAIVLAIRLYQIEHENTLPESLSELVPKYLTAVPKDPFDPADGPIRYLLHHSPPELYSVGLNGLDDHGSERSDPAALLEWLPAWRHEDAVFPIVSTPRIAPPQNQAGN